MENTLEPLENKFPVIGIIPSSGETYVIGPVFSSATYFPVINFLSLKSPPKTDTRTWSSFLYVASLTYASNLIVPSVTI